MSAKYDVSMGPYEKSHYKPDENPFVRMHTHELRLLQKEKVDYMKGPGILRKEMETASREQIKAKKGKESELLENKDCFEQEVSRYDYLRSLLEEFEASEAYARDRSARNCIEYVAFHMVIETLCTLNKQIGKATIPKNTDAILYRTGISLFESEAIRGRIKQVLKSVVEGYEVQNLDPASEEATNAVCETIREIFEKELTEQN